VFSSFCDLSRLMTVSTTADAPVDLDVDLLLFPVTARPSTARFKALSRTFGPTIQRAGHDFAGEEGDVRVVYPELPVAPRVSFVGLGPVSSLDSGSVRRAAAAGADVAAEHEADAVACVLPGEEGLEDEVAAQGLVEGFVLGAYRYTRYKTDDPFEGPSTFLLHVGEDRNGEAVDRGARRGDYRASATGTARDLVNRSPDEKTAQQLAEQIVASGNEHGYGVETWEEEWIREEGMGGLLAVNRGSFDPPTVSVLRWVPDEAVNDRPVVVAGKGVVFDTGGLSLKDTKGSMDKMKSDMAGAAAVVGLFEALSALEVPLKVVGLVPATDNRPGRQAYVPGDVVEMHDGTTVEVMNTDAEGRLLLADALSYASSAYNPELVVDVATLTGSCVVALGSQAAGLMTNDTEEAAERLYAIQRAGERTGERVHPLPMYEEYEDALESPVADCTNVGGRAGAITAAKFLEQFVDAPWMHLDIAGPAFRDEPAANGYEPEGGTGFGVRLLASYLTNYVSVRNQT